MKQHSLGVTSAMSDSSCGGASSDWEGHSDTESRSSGISPGKDATPSAFNGISPTSSTGSIQTASTQQTAPALTSSGLDQTSGMCDSFDEEEGELVIALEENDESSDEIIDVV